MRAHGHCLRRGRSCCSLTEIEYETEEARIRMSRQQDVPAMVMPPMAAPAAAAAAPAPAPAAAPAPEAAEDEGLTVFSAPMVGTFYRSPNPESDPFISEGSKIAPGTVLCIVEAMKLLNEIESDVGGIVREILVENGQAVEFGQPLFLIEKL